jgi:tripartite-type tricarboxylate transporter receptor subunit TctC
MPARVPEAIVAKANRDIGRALNAPDVKAKLAAQGIDVETGTPQALAQRIREDYERWGRVVRATGIKAE